MAFTKLDAGITDSTIWQAPDATRIVWITLLAMADKDGYVGASMPGLAGRARVPLEACIQAVATFMAPDEWSRTRDFDGRRLAEAEGGWVLLNHAKYREAEDRDKRRERSRIAMAKLRAKRRGELTVNNVAESCTLLLQAEAEAEAEAELQTDLAETPAKRAPKAQSDFETFYRLYPKKRNRLDALKAWKQTAKQRPELETVIAGLERCAASRDWLKDAGQFIPYPARWLRAGGWDSYPAGEATNGHAATPDPTDHNSIEMARAWLLGLLESAGLSAESTDAARSALQATAKSVPGVFANLSAAGFVVRGDEITELKIGTGATGGTSKPRKALNG